MPSRFELTSGEAAATAEQGLLIGHKEFEGEEVPFAADGRFNLPWAVGAHQQEE